MPRQCCCGAPQTVTKAALGLDDNQAQGLDDFFKNLLGSICGCGDDKRRKELHTKVLFSAKKAFPTANEDCLSKSITGLIDAIGKSIGVLFTHGSVQFVATLISEIAVPLSEFIQCVFGQPIASRFNLYSGMVVASTGFVTQFTIPPVLINALISCVLNSLCGSLTGAGGNPSVGGCYPPVAPVTPPTPNPGGGCCPPSSNPNPGGPSGWTPSTDNRCS
jgi:hypothetical protein